MSRAANHPRGSLALPILLVSLATTSNPARSDRPNVIVIMSDDQGVGDYGFNGNELIRTPHLDAMQERAGYLSEFYVSPVCAPTRACLMTGRYNYRTRCIDTFKGRAMMDTDEVTLAEALNGAGYRTGIFGKWHLGDHYPMRPMDQGFDVSLIHRGGGIGQSSDPLGAEGKYTDPTLIADGVETSMKGYCTDIYFDAAMRFIGDKARSDQPFFAYIATNAPHGPFHDVPDDLYQQYKDVDFGPIMVEGHLPKNEDEEYDRLARIAAMITNIDNNVGRLFDRLKALNTFDNTIVVYLDDNGPNTWRYVGNRRGKKGGVDEGGVRSPLLFHWPAKVAATTHSDAVCAHIDLMPTLLEACEVDPPRRVSMDGRSFLPLLTRDHANWPDRTLVLQAHRGNKPVRYHHFTLLSGPWKLVHPTGFQKEDFAGKPKPELYNLEDDPRQTRDLAESEPDVLGRLIGHYNAWFDDVSSTRIDNYSPPRIVIGSSHEPKTVLTRQDLRTPTDGSKQRWLLDVQEAGRYKVELLLAKPAPTETRATVSFGSQGQIVQLSAGKQRGHTTVVRLPRGHVSLSARVENGNEQTAVHQVVVSKLIGQES